MVNPTLLHQLAGEHRHDALVAAERRSSAEPGLTARERIGWSLVGIGASLALGRGGPSPAGARVDTGRLGLVAHR